jgi:hypothetical protein
MSLNPEKMAQEALRAEQQAEGVRKDAYPSKCPITGRPYFMTILHPTLGLVPSWFSSCGMRCRSASA